MDVLWWWMFSCEYTLIHVHTGHNVVLHACTIEDGCLVGMGSTLLDGVKVCHWGKNECCWRCLYNVEAMKQQ